MADTTLPAVTAEVITPLLRLADGQATATSLQIAEHFGKRHTNVLRAINNLGCSEDFNELNFERVDYIDDKGERRPMYHIARDGFALLAMGFTGKEAMRWKEAYITAFNAMETKLRSLYVAPLLSENEFRNGIRLRSKLVLMEQSRSTLRELVAEAVPALRRNLYWQLRLINDALGIPTESAEQLLGADATFALLAGAAAQEGGAA